MMNGSQLRSKVVERWTAEPAMMTLARSVSSEQEATDDRRAVVKALRLVAGMDVEAK